MRGVAGKPIAGATLDIWQADGDGHYDAQHGGDDPWMRGIFKSDANGHFVVQTVLPVPYSIPMDGSVGEMVARTNISPMRPSHIHFLIDAPGHHRLVTHPFKKFVPLYHDRRRIWRQGALDLGVQADACRQHDADGSYRQSAVLVARI